MISHQAISASAGSGKTFQLAHRYIKLLAGGIKPERIIALTFSRKAAGEIFDSIIKYLRLAAGSEAVARETSERIGLSLCQDDFLQLLREVLESIHRLHISTIDSFTVGVIQSFPMELGVSSVFQVMENEGAQAITARQEVLGRIFNSRLVDRSAQSEFLEAFKQATYGQEEKGLVRNLDKFIGEYRSKYRILPDGDCWGNPDRIWPGGTPWLRSTDDVKSVAKELEALLKLDEIPEKVRRRWNTFLESVVGFGFNSPWTRDIEYLTEKMLDELEGLRQGNASIKIERAKCHLSAEESRLCLEILTHIMKTQLVSSLERTRGIYRVLDQYEQFYSDMRRLGKLTFDDVQYLLTSSNIHSGGMLLSRVPSEECRLYIDYRLDCKLDHWLLDEFQDTSDLQWEVLRNLVDEILQDQSGERSFFYVGDVKQAIYGWRGGNARLFGKVLDHYGDVIQRKPLSTSFRSSGPVVEAVNRIFSSLPDILPKGTISEWERIWQEHQSQEGFVPESGYVALIEPPCNGGSTKPAEEDRYHVASQLLKELNPVKRGLSTAILVRSNERGRRITNFLRQECPDMPVVHEGRAAIKDNPVVSLLLSLIQFAAHPGDTMAWRHLEMSPLYRILEEEGMNQQNLPLRLLREIQSDGFEAFFRRWGCRLDESTKLDDFGYQRLRNLVEAASIFDGGSEPDCNEFMHFIDNYTINEPATENTVRVMTVHQSKGLGFDIVILPDLQNNGITRSSEPGMVIARDSRTDQPLWALNMPRRLVCLGDPVLSSQLARIDEQYCFDELSVLYVALTRSRQGLYMITSYPGKSSTSTTQATLVKTQLCHDPGPTEGHVIPIGGEEFTGLYETGTRDWYASITPFSEPCPPAESPTMLIDHLTRPSRRALLRRVSPSEQVERIQNAGELFSESSYLSSETGKAIHELLRMVRWVDETDMESVYREWQLKSPAEEEFKQRVIEHLRQTLSSEEVLQALSRPEGDPDLWFERHFEVIIEDKWVTGDFDRAVIFRNDVGEPLRAVIIDYKSRPVDSASQLEQALRDYRPQMTLYAQALSHILNLDPLYISCQLIFTWNGVVRDI
ncbi:MAG: UvrD-helicase domain-containing protein [Dehalococcoidia bacterium]